MKTNGHNPSRHPDFFFQGCGITGTITPKFPGSLHLTAKLFPQTRRGLMQLLKGAASGSWYVRGMFLCRISGSFQVWSESYTYTYIYTYILYYIIYYIYYIYLLDSCRTMQKLIVVGWIARQQGKSKDSQMAMSVTRKYVLPLDEIWVLSHLKQQ